MVLANMYKWTGLLFILLFIQKSENMPVDTTVTKIWEDSLQNKIDFNGNISMNNQQLVIRYSVSNHSEEILFLFNKIYAEVHEGGVFDYNKNLAYVYYRDGILNIRKAIPEKPEDVDVEKRLIPCVSKIEPGASFSEEFTINNPVALCDPYSTVPASEKQPAHEFYRVEFDLGYFTATAKGSALAKKVNTTNGDALLFDPFNSQHMKLFSVTRSLKGSIKP